MVQDDNSEVELEPKVGKIFDSDTAAFECYRAYGNSVGFGVVTKRSRKNDDGRKSHITYSCYRGGKHTSTAFNPLRPQPTKKRDCQARMSISLQHDGKWRLNSIVLDHNHDMLDLEQTRYLKCNRFIPAHAKRQFELNAAAGIRLNKTMASCVIEAGGPQNLSYTKRDIRNLMDKLKRSQLKEGDAEAMAKYFQKMQKDNNEFFYSIDVDDDDRLVNVFWADARSREAYKEFGDVVTFDTTYLVNKHDMPFAPFVGVNHHGQSILFGCGLITREDTSTFVWLLTTWLECMNDLYPNAIITDQCMAMKNAISKVFPNTRHRWCLWHIMKKIRDKLKGYKEYQSIKREMKNAVYESLYPADFEKNWCTFIQEYNLADNSWLNGLYEEKNMWVPAYVKDTFWAGMSTTQRSESINAFFDGYILPTTSLKEFVEQYDKALGDNVQNEEEEDARCMSFQITDISPFPIEEQFQAAYTLQKLKQFNVQMALKIGITNIIIGPVVDGISQFTLLHKMKVGKKHPRTKQFTFIVHYNEKLKEANCNCRTFESKGIVCSHMLAIWAHESVDELPDKYILKRWKKNLLRRHTKVKISYSNWQRKPECHRYDQILNIAREVAEKAMISDKKTAIVVDKMREALEKVNENDDEQCANHEPIHRKISKENPNHLGDPAKGIRKGKPPTKRRQPTSEKIVNKKYKINTEETKNLKDNECYYPFMAEESTNFDMKEAFVD